MQRSSNDTLRDTQNEKKKVGTRRWLFFAIALALFICALLVARSMYRELCAGRGGSTPPLSASPQVEAVPEPDEAAFAHFQDILATALQRRTGRLLEGLDQDRSLLPIGITRIELTDDGELSLHCAGELAGNEGETVTVTGVLDLTLLEIGGAGFRVLIYHMENGALCAFDPYSLAVEHRLRPVELFAPQAMITDILSQEGADGASLFAVSLGGERYSINDCFDRID